MSKFVFITGGVVSGLGKGITAASLGRLLKSRGLKVTIAKLDPYINVDPGTISPLQHGEVFVTEDGAETDLDLGHYERFMDVNLTEMSNVTTGKIYWSILTKERRGDFLGSTVQVIPHVTNEIKERIARVARESEADVAIIEVGGTVGDIESLPFLEAIRQMKSDVGRDSCLYVHVTLVPMVGAELKTKPTQHSVKELRSIGIQPDIIVCRSQGKLSDEIKKKIALFCDITPEAVIPNADVASIYEVPLLFAQEGLDEIVVSRLNLGGTEREMSQWEAMVERIKNPNHCVRVGVVGKYVALPDAYMSIAEALRHGGIENDAHVEIEWVSAESVEERGAAQTLSDLDAVLVPGGFGVRGVEGKIRAAQFCRETGVPFFGICLGMHSAVIEIARNVLGLEGAHSLEFDPESPHPVVHLGADQHGVEDLGGTMMVGVLDCLLEEGSLAHRAYGQDRIRERHRHRYEMNNAYRSRLVEAGLHVSGRTIDDRVVEIVELAGHPWFVGCQFHPELKSRPNRAHPLFKAFVEAALKQKEARQAQASPAKLSSAP